MVRCARVSASCVASSVVDIESEGTYVGALSWPVRAICVLSDNASLRTVLKRALSGAGGLNIE